VSAPGISIAIAVPKPDGTSRPVESLRAAGMQSSGVIVAVDDETRTVQRFAPDGRPLGQMIIIPSGPVPDRMAIGPLDEIALLDEKTITLFNRDGQQIGRIDFKGTSYLLRKPVDLAYDALGHLYVLDREMGALVVFGPSRQWIATFTGPDKGPGSLRRATAIALDSQGTLYVADDATERVYVFK
jgi:DNA-binding beta-propeller fold protein YncE